VEVDFENLPTTPSVGEQYTRALIILRRRRSPVASFYVPVRDGRCDRELYHRSLTEAVRPKVWQWKADDYLGPRPSVDLPPSTVAICTRERPEDLSRALRAVVALRPAATEILVVDNRPVTPRTRELVARFANVRYILEDRGGLDAARNRALREAGTAIVAFTDDDATPESDWLEHLLRPFEDPRVWCTSGLILPMELETPAQEWFERYSPFGRGFDRQVFDGTSHDLLAVARIGAGANMALRRQVLTELGGFDEALDAGTVARSGGDHEMFGRILAAGWRIVYEPSAVSWHRHRRTWDELRDVLSGYGVGVYATWTRRLLFEGEFGVLRHAVRWLRWGQIPGIWRALWRHPDSVPMDLLLAELRGCVAGPPAYFRARRHLRAMEGA
jgi:GT2 family glycosyltransferase